MLLTVARNKTFLKPKVSLGALFNAFDIGSICKVTFITITLTLLIKMTLNKWKKNRHHYSSFAATLYLTIMANCSNNNFSIQINALKALWVEFNSTSMHFQSNYGMWLVLHIKFTQDRKMQGWKDLFHCKTAGCLNATISKSWSELIFWCVLQAKNGFQS